MSHAESQNVSIRTGRHQAARGWRLGVSLALFWLVVTAAGPAACRRASAPENQADPAARSAAPRTDGGGDGGQLTIFVSIDPQAYFVERLAGGRARVEVLVGPGQNPHAYEPTPHQMAALAAARVYFRIGLGFEEALVPKLRGAFRELEIVDTRAGIRLRQMESGHGCDHHAEAAEHDHAHDHAHGPAGDDPHTWLDPRLVQTQARTMCDVLCRIDPARAEEYRRNLTDFLADLDALNARLAEALAPVRGKEIFVFHPAFGYFADAYGLRQAPIEVQGKEPSPKDVAALIELARARGVRVIFVQPQFSTRTAEIIAREIGGAVVPLDDLARDYLSNMESMARQVRAALSQQE